MLSEGLLSKIYTQNPTLNVTTRFPPKPNGFLHLGHSKAIAINIGFARYHKRKWEYFTAIADIIKWLGFEPVKVTYLSDYFDRLYELAEKLILKDGAYVCHCETLQRGGGKGVTPRYASLRDGKYAPGKATLRMKQDLESGNTQMSDLTAYRIIQPRKGEEDESMDNNAGIHHRTGDKWRIYPTYDFAHCLVDSFEGITHSLCTAEFEPSRTSYNWLCDRLGVYRPMQKEYDRLNLAGTVLSKRKIADLIAHGHVRDWDDSRLYTLIALKRRGILPGAILSFVNGLGVSKATTTIEVKQFEQSVRHYLERTVPRLMIVLDPIPVIIDNLPEDHLEMVEVPFSKDPEFGAHTVPFTRIVYIDRADFQETASKDFFRLAPGKAVGLLRVPYPITAMTFEKDQSTGLVTSIHARYDKPEDGPAFKKPKAYIHWVADCPSLNSPVKATVRAYDQLFTVENPDTHSGGFLSIINPDSEKVFPNAMVETGLDEIIRRAPWPSFKDERGEDPEGTAAAKAPESVRFQGMRVGYFCLDRDSSHDDVVLNRIVTLKEDSRK
ncbi:tRNA synthetases class I, catalytic domain-containing protein [Aspergillus filifer]